MRLEHAKVISRTTSEVFETLTRFEDRPKFVSEVASAYQLSEGPAEVGTRFMQKGESKGQDFAVVSEVTHLEKDRLLRFTTPDGPHDREWSYSVSPAPGGARLYLVFEKNLPWYLKLLGPLYERRANEAVRRQLLRFTMFAESRRRSGFFGTV